MLRLDEFGKPANSNPKKGSPIYASGFTQVSGMCPTQDGADGRPGPTVRRGEVLLPLAAGRNYTTIKDGAALWTWTAADGGASDCSISNGLLANTSLDKQGVDGCLNGPQRHLHRHTPRNCWTTATGGS